MSVRRNWLPSVLAAALSSTLAVAALAKDEGKPNEDMQAVLDALQKLEPKPIETLHPVLARSQPSGSDAVIQLLQDRGTLAPDKLPPVGKVELKAIPGPEGAQLAVRVYTPRGDGPFPVIVYYHGGGWVLASTDTYDASARGLADLNSAVVVSVEYRRAPEHKFPAATEDAYAALHYVSEHAAEFNGDPARVAVAGESAGGNLATVVCLMASERGGKMPVHQVLIYPVTDYSFDTPSEQRNADAKPLNLPMMRWFFEQYLKGPADGKSVFVSPLRATTSQLRSLPPATIITAEIDPLRDQGQAYAKKLKAAGVNTELKDYTGVTHEFFGMALVVDQARAANAFVKSRLSDAFEDK